MELEVEKINVARWNELKSFFEKFPLATSGEKKINEAISQGLISSNSSEEIHDKIFIHIKNVKMLLNDIQLFGFILIQSYWLINILKIDQSEYSVETLNRVLYFHKPKYTVESFNILNPKFLSGIDKVGRHLFFDHEERDIPRVSSYYYILMDDTNTEIKLKYNKETRDLIVDLIRGFETYYENVDLPRVYPEIYEMRGTLDADGEYYYSKIPLSFKFVK